MKKAIIYSWEQKRSNIAVPDIILAEKTVSQDKESTLKVKETKRKSRLCMIHHHNDLTEDLQKIGMKLENNSLLKVGELFDAVGTTH